MNPPLLPPACEKMSVAGRLCYVCRVTYANDGNVLDVVVGRHAVGELLGTLRGCCKLNSDALVTRLDDSEMWERRRDGQRYLSDVAGTKERMFVRLTPTTSYP